jgi:hypothetical protein
MTHKALIKLQKRVLVVAQLFDLLLVLNTIIVDLDNPIADSTKYKFQSELAMQCNAMQYNTMQDSRLGSLVSETNIPRNNIFEDSNH